MRRFALFLLGMVLLSGCVVNDRYKACLADPDCYAEVQTTRNSTYGVVKSAASVPGVPTVPEVLALLVSNLAAFGVGVYKGGRKVKGG